MNAFYVRSTVQCASLHTSSFNPEFGPVTIPLSLMRMRTERLREGHLPKIAELLLSPGEINRPTMLSLALHYALLPRVTGKNQALQKEKDLPRFSIRNKAKLFYRQGFPASTDFAALIRASQVCFLSSPNDLARRQLLTALEEDRERVSPHPAPPGHGPAPGLGTSHSPAGAWNELLSLSEPPLFICKMQIIRVPYLLRLMRNK